MKLCWDGLATRRFAFTHAKTVWRPLAGLVLAVTLVMAAPGDGAAAAKGEYLAYVGTYTGAGTRGIYVLRFTPRTGEMSEPELVAEIGNPAWVTLDSNQHFLYAVTEHDSSAGTVNAFRIDRSSGHLTALNSVPSGGQGACQISIDQSGKNAVVTNCQSGTIAVRRINADRSLGGQAGSDQHAGPAGRPRSVYFSPDNRFALSPDSGSDGVSIYRFDAATGVLTPNDPPFAKVQPGFGARRLAFHPNGKFVYVLGETAAALTVFSWDAERGALTELQKIGTVPAGFGAKNNSQEVRVHPSGKYVFVSNGGTGTIASFSIGANGTLTVADHMYTQGDLPTDFAVDPTGGYLLAANQATNNIVLFKIDQNTGRLLPSGKAVHVEAPVSLSGFLPIE